MAQRLKFAAIGCSFTNYQWPTWADFLHADNYGLSGIGNDRIWYILNQLYDKDMLKDYDAVVIQWASAHRFDYKINKENKLYDSSRNGWTFNDGNIAFSTNNTDIWKRLKYWYNEEYESLRTEHFINGAKAILEKANIKQYHMTSRITLDPTKVMEHGQLFETKQDMIKVFNGTYDDLVIANESSSYTFQTAPWSKNKPFKDLHPTIPEHANVAEGVARHFGVTIAENKYELYMKLHGEMLAGLHPDYDSLNTVQERDEYKEMFERKKDIFQL